MAFMYLYCNNPTAGGTDGTEMSEETGLSPLTIGPLDASINQESAATKVAIRCMSGYLTSAETTITPTGATANMWALAPDNNGVAGTFHNYGSALTLVAGITAANTIFWIKAKASNTENPTTDKTVTLNVVCSSIHAV